MTTNNPEQYDPKTAKAKIVDVTQGTPRTELTCVDIQVGIDAVVNKLYYRLEEKGYHGAASTHEILGVLDEEMYELRKAIHENNREQFIKELADVAVACIWGIDSNSGKTLDW